MNPKRKLLDLENFKNWVKLINIGKRGTFEINKPDKLIR